MKKTKQLEIKVFKEKISLDQAIKNNPSKMTNIARILKRNTLCVK